MGCSQEVFSVPGLENTRPKQGNAFTCHNQEQHAVITQLGRQPECAVLQLFLWHLLYRSSSRELGLALTNYNSTATRKIKIGNGPAWLIFSEWEMFQQELSLSLLNLGWTDWNSFPKRLVWYTPEFFSSTDMSTSEWKIRVISCRFAVATSWAKKYKHHSLTSDIQSQAGSTRKERKSYSQKCVLFQNHMSLKMTFLVSLVTGQHPE